MMTSLSQRLQNVPLPNPSSLRTLWHLQHDPLRFLWQQADEGGGHFYLGRQRVELFATPSACEDIFFTHVSSLEKELSKRASLLLGDGLLNSSGDKHRQRRKLIQPAFGAKHLRRYAEAMHQAADAFHPPRHVTDTAGAMTALAIDVAGQCLFGESSGLALGKLQGLSHLFELLSHPLAPLLLKLPLPASRSFHQSQSAIENWVQEKITHARQQKRKQNDDQNLLSLLVKTELSDAEILR